MAASQPARPPADRSLAIPRLGVGIGYRKRLRGLIQAHRTAVDFLLVVPDTVESDRGPGRRPRYVPDAEDAAFLAGVARDTPVVAHAAGLFAGGAERGSRERLSRLAHWHRWLGFAWHSDHLALHAAGPGTCGDPCLPLPFDRDTLALAAARAREVQRALALPLLLGNVAARFEYLEQDLDEAAFLNEIARRSGCGLLLDLHGLEVSAMALGHEPHEYLDRLDLDAVREIHVGGSEGGWGLLDRALSRCPQLSGLALLPSATQDQTWDDSRHLEALGRLHDAWRRHLPAPGSRAS